LIHLTAISSSGKSEKPAGSLGLKKNELSSAISGLFGSKVPENDLSRIF